MMKAAVFHGIRDLQIQEYPLRKLRPGEVLLKVHACGVCGTDVHIYEGDEGSATVDPPVILGHEFSGEICETASDVQTIHVGDRVAVDPNIQCGKCSHCRKGKIHLCQNLTAIGVTMDGGFAEYCIVLEQQMYKLPDHVSFEQGALAEPIACCLHGIDLAEINAGDEVLIIGGGTIGLIMAQLANNVGAAKIIVSEPLENKRNLALKLGADLVVDPVTDDLQDFIHQHSGDGVDVAIECVGAKTTMEQAIRAARRGGVIMMFGLTSPDCQVAIHPFDLFRRELTIRSSFINPFTQARAIELLSSGRLNVTDLIAELVPLEQLDQVFKNKESLHKGKIIVSPQYTRASQSTLDTKSQSKHRQHEDEK